MKRGGVLSAENWCVALAEHNPPILRAANFRHRLGHDGRRVFDRTYNILLNRHVHRLHHLWRGIYPGDIEKFFKFPSNIDAADIVYQILSHVGTFPFCRHGPVPLRKDELMIAVSMMTDHYQTVLEVPEGVQGSKLNWESWDRLELVFDSLAVEGSTAGQEVGGQNMDRSVDADSEWEFHSGSGSSLTQSSGSSRPHVALPRRRLNLGPGEPPSNAEPIDCDLLVMAAYDSLGIKTYPKHPESHGYIPVHKLRRFLHLMLITRVAWPSEKLWAQVEEDHRVDTVVDSMVRTFIKATTMSRSPGVTLEHLYRIVPVYFPHIFEGLMRLFGEFLSEKRLAFPWLRSPARGPLLERHWKDGSLGQMIMCDGVIMQLGMFLPRSQFLCGPALIFHSLPGEEVNMAEFESRTNGLKRTIFLLKGTTVPNKGWEGGKTTWHDSLVDSTKPGGSTPETRTYGVYLPEPWQTTGEFSYGGQDMVLFRLEPTHEVFPIAGTKGRDYMWFPEPREKRRSMITFGSPPRHRRWQRPTWPWPTQRDLGGISLMVEGGMRNAVFLHDRQQPHSFRPSALDEDAVVNEVLAVERVEVWRFR